MSIVFPHQKQTLALNNIGMQLIVRMNDRFYPVTHACLSVDIATDIMRSFGCFIAHVLTDGNGVINAIFMAIPEPIEALDGHVDDLQRAGHDYTMLYVRNHAGAFQVAKIVAECPFNPDRKLARDNAILQGNAFMSMNPDTALITASETNDDKEVKILYFIASNESASE